MTEEFISKIAPGLTLYTVLVTLGVVAFRLGKYFKDQEKSIYSEYLEKVSDIKANFRRAYVDPLIERNLDGAVSEAIESAFGVVKSRTKDEQGNSLTGEVLAQAFSDASMDRYRSDMLSQVHTGGQFVSSLSGASFLEALEKNFRRAYDITRYYDRAKYYDKFSYIVMFLLGLAFFAGLVILILPPIPGFVSVSYVDVLLALIMMSIYGAIRFHRAEQALIRVIEESKLYPQLELEK
jgi:uncharacterized BrkB/YihY/UPF0761 family membrane protein